MPLTGLEVFREKEIQNMLQEYGYSPDWILVDVATYDPVLHSMTGILNIARSDIDERISPITETLPAALMNTFIQQVLELLFFVHARSMPDALPVMGNMSVNHYRPATAPGIFTCTTDVRPRVIGSDERTGMYQATVVCGEMHTDREKPVIACMRCSFATGKKSVLRKVGVASSKKNGG
jgi:hypothetical protein